MVNKQMPTRPIFIYTYLTTNELESNNRTNTSIALVPGRDRQTIVITAIILPSTVLSTTVLVSVSRSDNVLDNKKREIGTILKIST